MGEEAHASSNAYGPRTLAYHGCRIVLEIVTGFVKQMKATGGSKVTNVGNRKILPDSEKKFDRTVEYICRYY
jgi:hypothetical protein